LIFTACFVCLFVANRTADGTEPESLGEIHHRKHFPMLSTVACQESIMKRFFTLEYWEDDGWYVGRLSEVPGVFSQGETIEELKENIAHDERCG
jgi:hypothetical protein